MAVNKRLLYFSLNPRSTGSFLNYIARTFQDRRNSFSICEVDKKKPFRHASELAVYLGQQLDLGNLYVIIDYLSFYNCHLDDFLDEGQSEKDKICITENVKKKNIFSVSQASEIIAKTILQFPEVMFLFDESWQKGNSDNEKITNDIDFTDFIFYKGSDFVSYVFSKYHQYRVYDETPFAFIRRNWDNLYDGSNLRFAIKRYIYEQLKVKKYNFSAIQNSRSENLALCVEEEHAQIRFNSYALYANGFRVMPISTSHDLKDANNSEFPTPKIVVRDYDLQFPDENTDEKDKKIIDDEEVKINIVDYIRGIKFLSDSDINTKCWYHNRWYVSKPNDKDKNKFDYWSSLLGCPIFFISKGAPRIHILDSKRQYNKVRKKLLTKEAKILSKELALLPKTDCQYEITERHLNIIKGNQDSTDSPKNSLVFLDGTPEQILRGIEKPVSGLYLPFHSFEEVLYRYYSFGLSEIVIKRHAKRILDKCKNKKEKKIVENYLYNEYKAYFETHIVSSWRIKHFIQKYPILQSEESIDLNMIIDADRRDKCQRWSITTERENHNHGVPLDLYDLAKSMIARAADYYKNEKYIKSAIISSEAIEVLNGFHEALMLQAYYISATSENAIAMNTIGGSEQELENDTYFRIKKIEHDVDRMLDREKDRRTLKYNILNQIFVDCRKFCQDKEHFDAADAFLNALGHLNEGYNPRDIWEEIKEILKNIRKGISSMAEYVKNGGDQYVN